MRMLILLFTMALVGGCRTVCVTGTGPATRVPLDVPAFTGIEAEGSLEVRVSPGPAQAVEVEGPADLVGLVTTEVRKGIWHIATSDCYSTDQPIVVHIRIPRLDHITVSGSGNVTADSVFGAGRTLLAVHGSGDLIAHEVHEERLIASVQGSGSITITGTADHFDAEVQGSGDLLGLALSASHAEVAVQGSGDVELTAVEQLNASVQGSGDVRYRGQPKVASRIQGSGTVVPVQ
jgi:hypothetical protein